jgi:hypothetical protein
MKDVNGKTIQSGNLLTDGESKYKVIEKDGKLYAKSLFDDSGCGEYLLYQERINRNEFVVII